jgi:nitrile hydratase accessory protein
MTVALHERGLFGWSEWAKKLGAELKSGDAYYDCWMRALEGVLAERGVAGPAEVDVVAAAWERAAHATPHGQPIVLENDPEHGTAGPLPGNSVQHRDQSL